MFRRPTATFFLSCRQWFPELFHLEGVELEVHTVSLACTCRFVVLKIIIDNGRWVLTADERYTINYLFDTVVSVPD